MNPIDQDGHQIQIAEFLLAQFFQLRRTGLDEFPAHAGFLDPVPGKHRVDRTLVIPRGQSGHDAFAYRALPPSIVLQSRVTVQFDFLALACAHPRPRHRHFLSAENHVTRLPPPAHCTRLRPRPVRWPYAPRYLVFQNGPQNLHPSFTAQLLHPGLQILPHLHQWQRHLD